MALSTNIQREEVHQRLEPRTNSIQNKFKALSKASIPTQIMVWPVIQRLNSYVIPTLLKRAEAGARDDGYMFFRLNGQLGVLFANWLNYHFPDRKEMALNRIK